jgi:hypothetical protein
MTSVGPDVFHVASHGSWQPQVLRVLDRAIIKLMPMERICFGNLDTVKEQLADLLKEKADLIKALSDNGKATVRSCVIQTCGAALG